MFVHNIRVGTPVRDELEQLVVDDGRWDDELLVWDATRRQPPFRARLPRKPGGRR